MVAPAFLPRLIKGGQKHPFHHDLRPQTLTRRVETVHSSHETDDRATVFRIDPAHAGL
ncbi:MAG: hypothetical protein AB1792_04875 [Candidatus Zixiibacteriota bacterium]